MTSYSIIIPVYSIDSYLDICLLSILGQTQIPDVEAICVPVADCMMNGADHLIAWHKRDERVKIFQPEDTTATVPTLYDALRFGIAHAEGRYIMFMNQTDVVSSAENLLQTFEKAEQLDVQVLLAAKEQRTNTDALSPSWHFKPNGKLLPESIKNNVYSVEDASANIFIMTPPLVYGNIYQRKYMAALFQSPHVFGNAGDIAVSQIALLHAERVSHTDVATICSCYEKNHHVRLTEQEVSMTGQILHRQIAVKMATNNAGMVVQNIMLYYFAHILSSCHPYPSFVQIVEHYRTFCQRLSDPVANEITPHLYGCWKYISAIASSTADSLIETYTMPMRGLVFHGQTKKFNDK